MYGFNITLNDTFDNVITRVTEALKTEGFGILTEISVDGTFKKKLDVDIRPYKILGACNPNYAHKAITQEPDIGLLLPCNVVVREEEDGSINVCFMDPMSVMGLVQRPELVDLGKQVKEKLMRARDILEKNGT